MGAFTRMPMRPDAKTKRQRATSLGSRMEMKKTGRVQYKMDSFACPARIKVKSPSVILEWNGY